MVTISRTTVMELIAENRIKYCSESQLIDFLDDYQVIDGENFDVQQLHSLVCEALNEAYKGASNGFLSDVYELMTGVKGEVVGEVEELYVCPCCSYKTLTEEYDSVEGTGYDICNYCNWEDDGTNDVTQRSGVNRGSINEYRDRIASNPNYFYKKMWNKNTSE